MSHTNIIRLSIKEFTPIATSCTAEEAVPACVVHIVYGVLLYGIHVGVLSGASTYCTHVCGITLKSELNINVDTPDYIIAYMLSTAGVPGFMFEHVVQDINGNIVCSHSAAQS